MHLKRKAYQQLLDWKKLDGGRSAILIEGVRRVGKSHLAKEFAKKEYNSFIFVDLSKDRESLKPLFEQAPMNLNELLAHLSFIYKTRLHERNSCIVFDGVQLYPKARQLIKHLVEDGRYDYIETGSHVSTHSNTADILLPSEESRLELLPLSFEEFLEAIDRTDAWEIICEHYNAHKPLSESIHRELMKLFRHYLIVGGMPEAVCEYATHLDMLAVRQVQRRILGLIQDDFTSLPHSYSLKVQALFDALPAQLAKRDKKFVLTHIQPHARMRDYEGAFNCLADSKSASLSFNSTDPSIGLRMSQANSKLKCYMTDTGLLTTLATLGDKSLEEMVDTSLLLGSLGVSDGMFFENAVAQMLRSVGHKLFYHSQLRDDGSRRNLEIDFLIRRKRKICPIVVRPEKISSLNSLDMFVAKYRKHLGKRYIISSQNLTQDGKTIYLPVYMTELL